MENNGSDNTHRIRAIDLFCGVGGSSCGAKAAGAEIVAGFDLWPLACQIYQANFPGTLIYTSKVEKLQPKSIAGDLGKIDLIIASPECTSHSSARGNRRRLKKSMDTALQVTRFAKVFKPRWIVIENVIQMRHWARYKEFIDKLKEHYQVREQVLVASNFGVPQIRKRLFILCDSEAMPPEITTPPDAGMKCAADVINMNGVYRYTPLDIPHRASATLERAKRAIEKVGTEQPFLLVYYGSDASGGWQRLDVPLRTVTTLDRFALVRPATEGYEMRMLQVPELMNAMGFPPGFILEGGTRRQRIHLLGNAVCPPVMKAIIETLTRHQTDQNDGVQH